MQSHGISPHFVDALLEGTRTRGVDTAPLLAAAGIVQGPGRVSIQAYAALMKSVALALDDEFFGHDAHRMKPGSFAMMGHAVIGCRTLRHALIRAVRFYGLILDDTIGAVAEADGVLRVEFRSVRPVAAFAHENLLIFLHRLACWLVNRRLPLAALGFAFPRPERSAEYRVVFGADAVFDQDSSFFAIDARQGSLPMVRDDAGLKEFLALAPETLFVRYRPSHGTAHRVRLQLAAMKLADWPDFAGLARSLGMSASTLHRRLADEDSNFQMIKDQIRRERAQTLLRRKDLSVVAIAEELGFAEPSAFHRAFRKWTGRAPGQFRKENLTGDL